MAIISFTTPHLRHAVHLFHKLARDSIYAHFLSFLLLHAFALLVEDIELNVHNLFHFLASLASAAEISALEQGRRLLLLILQASLGQLHTALLHVMDHRLYVWLILRNLLIYLFFNML